MNLKQLRVLMNNGGPKEYREILAALATDPRTGARQLAEQCRQRLEHWQQDKERLDQMYGYARQVWEMGYRLIAGVSEAGRGPLAGPVVAAAVILPNEVVLTGLAEGRRLPPRRREQLSAEIYAKAAAVGVGMVNPVGLDEAHELTATYQAMVQAIQNLEVPPDYLLVDSLHLPGVVYPQSPLAGGDTQCACIAAAAIVAKVTRDAYMIEIDQLYPEYGFANHKGYGTPAHRAALARYGPTPIHRQSAAATAELPLLPALRSSPQQ